MHREGSFEQAKDDFIENIDDVCIHYDGGRVAANESLIAEISRHGLRQTTKQTRLDRKTIRAVLKCLAVLCGMQSGAPLIVSFQNASARRTANIFCTSATPTPRPERWADWVPSGVCGKTGRSFRSKRSISQVEVSGGKLFTFIIRDVTERKLAEEALSSVNSRLIEAQEQERARIARELHDDLSRRMALLQIHLEQFQQDTTGLSSKARQQLHDIAEVPTEVSASIHDLSHQLHPSKLDTLGLVASLAGLCREFSEQHHPQVHFFHHDIPGQIPKDVTLCLFRIVQEALQNVVKHSGASEATVQLSVHDDRIELAICDPGVGFNPESAKGDASLGLISMRERLRLVGGHLAVDRSRRMERGFTCVFRSSQPTTELQT